MFRTPSKTQLTLKVEKRGLNVFLSLALQALPANASVSLPACRRSEGKTVWRAKAFWHKYLYIQQGLKHGQPWQTFQKMKMSNYHEAAPLAHPFSVTFKPPSQGKVFLINQDHFITGRLSNCRTAVHNLKSKKKQQHGQNCINFLPNTGKCLIFLLFFRGLRWNSEGKCLVCQRIAASGKGVV